MLLYFTPSSVGHNVYDYNVGFIFILFRETQVLFVDDDHDDDNNKDTKSSHSILNYYLLAKQYIELLIVSIILK